MDSTKLSLTGYDEIAEENLSKIGSWEMFLTDSSVFTSSYFEPLRKNSDAATFPMVFDGNVR